jgi:response regulator RpfG family c-di-GMP phosphodiesterase
MHEKILLVDDEPDVLKSFEALFRRRYRVFTALSGEKGLDLIEKEGPFSVIIADMHMPSMDGVTLLTHVAKRAPDTIRIMLTANADQHTAAEAVNKGSIFRFLNKPCPMDLMLQTLKTATEQYHLITAERILLEQTLKGSVEVLVEALSLSNPVAFQRTRRIQHIVKQLLDHLNINSRWEIEIAAALSQTGCLTVPEELLQKELHGLKLTPNEQKILNHHPAAGSRLIAHIPRLERVCEIIFLQRNGFRQLQRTHYSELTRLGASILKTAIDYDTLLTRGRSSQSAWQRLIEQPDNYDPDIVQFLPQLAMPSTAGTPQHIHVSNIQDGMIVAENIKSKNGLLVVPDGFEINETVRQRLINFAEQGLIVDHVRVYTDGVIMR